MHYYFSVFSKNLDDKKYHNYSTFLGGLSRVSNYVWLVKYIIIQKMFNMKGLYQVPLYYFLCTTDRVKYTHFEAKPENFLCPSLSSSKISVMVFNRFNKLLAISNFNLSVWQYKWLCRFFWKLFLFDWWIPPPLMDIYLSFKVTAKKFFFKFS